MGKNLYGQIGIQSKNSKDVISPVFENYRIKKVFCTQYCTFFLTCTSIFMQKTTKYMVAGSIIVVNSE
jgi:hypothetical protein